MSYTRSESIAADWNKACIRGDTKEQWPGNGLGLLGMATVTAKAANGERWESAKATRDCIMVEKSQISFGMAETNIHLNSSPLGKCRDPISTSRGNRPSPPGHNVVATSQLLPRSSLSLPKPLWASRMGAPEETLTRTTLMPSSSLDPLVYFLISKSSIDITDTKS